MRLDKHKIEMVNKNNSDSKNKAFERQIEQGRVTFDHQGNTIEVRGINTTKLPPEFKNIMGHKFDEADLKANKNLNVKKKTKENAEDDPTNSGKGMGLVCNYHNI
jgi:hypothetical protein